MDYLNRRDITVLRRAARLPTSGRDQVDPPEHSPWSREQTLQERQKTVQSAREMSSQKLRHQSRVKRVVCPKESIKPVGCNTHAL